MITTLTTLRWPFALLVIDTSTDQIWQVIDNYSLTTPATRTLRRPSQRWSTRTRPSLWTTVLWWTSTKTPRTRWSGGKISIDYYFDQWLEPIKSIEKPKLYRFIRLLHHTTCCRELQNTVYKYTHTQPLMVCFRELQNEIKALRHRLDNQRIDTGLS